MRGREYDWHNEMLNNRGKGVEIGNTMIRTHRRRSGDTSIKPAWVGLVVLAFVLLYNSIGY